VANLWDSRNTRWEALFDQAVAFAADRRVSDTLSMLKRIRSWQHRQSRYGYENHDWHDAELLWLQGVVLEHAGQSSKADPVWLRLARLYKSIARGGESSFLPRCARCAERELGFAPRWFSVATRLRHLAPDLASTSAAFRKLAVGVDVLATNTLDHEDSTRVEATNRTAHQSSAVPESAVSPARLRTKREAIRKTYRELDRPATVVELCEQYLRLQSQDGVVWAWYGDSLRELGRYVDAATALQTARGLVTTEDTRSFVLQCQGDLEYAQGHYPRAESYYREAVAEGVGDLPLILLGRVLSRLGQMNEAEHCLRRAVDANGSHSVTALYELGRILRARSALFEARRVFKQALAREARDEIRDGLADVERAIRLQSPPGGRQNSKHASSSA
jgi:tetratricopeptide (TPR) repeat protein